MVNVNAQEYIDKKYPKNEKCQRKEDKENLNKKREEITELDIRKGKVGKGLFNDGKILTGSLKLEGFINLRTLIVSSHQIIDLDVSGCPNLEELDCHSNKLNILNVTGCSNLKTIDCSNNNYIKELDLNACTKLNEVKLSECFELTSNTIKSDLIFNAKKTKLVRGPIKIKTKESDIRNILIVGITGNGKSALSNTLTDTSSANKFGEKGSSASVTKNFLESDIFKWKGKKYRVIDNIGFGDTNNISEKDILFKIGEGINSAKEGINQVLFVFRGRFAPEHVVAFNLFKDFIDEIGITGFTTLVRTNFKDFQNQEKCRGDKETLLSQSGKEFVETINSCNDILYVDNPPIPEIDEEDSEGERENKKNQISRNEKKRKDSRERILNYLAENCQEIYKLKEWDSIVSMVNNYNERKKEIEKSNVSDKEKEKELKRIESETAKEISEGIKVSVGANVPGIGGFTAAVEHTKQRINW